MMGGGGRGVSSRWHVFLYRFTVLIVDHLFFRQGGKTNHVKSVKCPPPPVPWSGACECVLGVGLGFPCAEWGWQTRSRRLLDSSQAGYTRLFARRMYRSACYSTHAKQQTAPALHSMLQMGQVHRPKLQATPYAPWAVLLSWLPSSPQRAGLPCALRVGMHHAVFDGARCW